MKKMSKIKYLQCIICLVVVFLSNTVAFCRTHQLSMNPVRIVFTDRKRVANVKISNLTDHRLFYAISTITMRKNDEGHWDEVQDESEKEMMLRKMIRYSPRRASIDPGKRQLVKMMLRKPKDLQPGEYVTWVQLLPIEDPADNLLGENTTEKDAVPIKINVDLVVKSNFPVIIQNGKISSQIVPEAVQIKPPEGTDGMPIADVVLQREGKASVFGNIYMNYIPANFGKARPIGWASEVAVYLSENSRSFPVRLKRISLEELRTGQLEVTFKPEIKDGDGKKYHFYPPVSKRFSLPLH